jgi:hypothetical protein
MKVVEKQKVYIWIRVYLKEEDSNIEIGDDFLINAHKLLPNVKKILLTGQADFKAVTNAINSADLYRYISKPWQNEDLILTIQEALKSYNQDVLVELQNIGKEKNNTVHWQISDCIPFPGTELWEELVELGHGDTLKNFNLYDGSPAHDGALEKTVGWLGTNYKPKYSEYSKDGSPTNLPSS